MVDRLKELRLRVEAKHKQLLADLAKARADAVGAANDNEEAIQKKLGELTETLFDGVEKVSDKTLQKLNDWLK